MINTNTRQPLTFQDFLEQLPDRGGIYELVNGEIVNLQATRGDSNVTDFLYRKCDREVDRLGLNYVVRRNVLIRTETSTGQEQGRHPDVCVVDKTLWNSDISAYSALTEPFQLAVEVASTNWRDDYIDKLDEYRRLGIREYWIVDDRAMASKQYLGEPKQPTVFVYLLVDGQYRETRFRGEEPIVSATFPELALTVAEIAAARLG